MAKGTGGDTSTCPSTLSASPLQSQCPWLPCSLLHNPPELPGPPVPQACLTLHAFSPYQYLLGRPEMERVTRVSPGLCCDADVAEYSHSPLHLVQVSTGDSLLVTAHLPKKGQKHPQPTQIHESRNSGYFPFKRKHILLPFHDPLLPTL